MTPSVPRSSSTPDPPEQKGITLDHTVTITNNLLLDLNYDFVRYVSNTRSGAAGSDPKLLGFSPRNVDGHYPAL